MINLVGLGPGALHHVTLEAIETLESSDVIFVRGGKHHPVPNALLARGKNVVFLGPLYHIAMRHAEVYEVITDVVLTASRLYRNTTYAVPGNIFVFETACDLIRRRAEAASVPLKLVPGISSIEAIYAVLGVDPGAGLAILDGGALADTYAPRLASIVLQPWSKLDPESITHVKAILGAHVPEEHPITIVSNVGFDGADFTRVDGTIGELDRLVGSIDPDWAAFYVPARAS
jgi:tetrapyrrole methylase family protein / MazG family protein